MFWEISPTGIPFRRSGKLLIAFWSPRRDGSWDRLLVSRQQQKMYSKPQCKIYELEKDMQIQRLGKKWRLSEEQKELIEKVNWWLKKNIKSDIIYGRDFIPKKKRRKKC